eukprot:Transcript_31344.p1 GENE.Transcript_31344~~Transcript_31344.p1  ORF type:complete len:306 (+),score=108.01 Transcript_31344:61-918(+)
MDGVLQLDTLAAALTHESFEVDTKDREDHTFSGIMFDVACQSLPRGPLEYLEVQAVAVRGKLGPMTVWTTPGGHQGKQEDKESWTLLHEAEHKASKRKFVELPFDQPVRLRVGERCGLYVHSGLSGDEGIVYDDQHQRLTHEDSNFKVFPGRAHLSWTPFGRRGMWWGSPWRREREFVGRVRYGVRWKMWTPQVHAEFPPPFRRAVLTMLLGTRRAESLLYLLDEELVFFIMNKCWWSDFGVEDAGRGSSRAAARKRRLFVESDDEAAEASSSATSRRKGKRRQR